MIGRDEAVRILTGLSTAYERIAAGMYALDGHRGLAVLRRGGLTGETASHWREVQAEIELLWARFTAVGSILEEVRAILGRDRLDDAARADLARRLTQPSVAVDGGGMPLPFNAVPSGPAVATWMTVGQLTEELDQRCAGVLSRLSDVEAASAAVVAAIVPVSESIDAVVALAGAVGEAGEAERGERLRADLAGIERAGLADPLIAAPGGHLADTVRAHLRELAEAVEDARRQLAEMVKLRDGYPQRRATLTALVEEVAAAEASVAPTQARVIEKIADPGLDALPGAASVLRARLAELDALADRQAWRELAARMSIVEDSARRARQRARDLVANAEGLLARREELRGRLAAYRAKAAARGLAEDEELTTLHTHAQALLFTAPCDLRASTRAVNAYQLALAGNLRERSSVDE